MAGRSSPSLRRSSAGPQPPSPWERRRGQGECGCGRRRAPSRCCCTPAGGAGGTGVVSWSGLGGAGADGEKESGESCLAGDGARAMTSRQAELYFSIVRLSACCASLLRRSTSFSTRTGGGFRQRGGSEAASQQCSSRSKARSSVCSWQGSRRRRTRGAGEGEEGRTLEPLLPVCTDWPRLCHLLNHLLREERSDGGSE